jgi:hypothetical protein
MQRPVGALQKALVQILRDNAIPWAVSQDIDVICNALVRTRDKSTLDKQYPSPCGWFWQVFVVPILYLLLWSQTLKIPFRLF